jgi:hypothetical protein
MEEAMTQRDGPSKSWLGLLGMYLAGVAVVLIICFLILDWMSGGTSPYLGAVTFLVLPGVVVFGCLLMLIGALGRRRQLKRAGRAAEWRDWIPWSGMEPGDPARLARRTLVGAVIALPFLGVMTYEGYHYTESNKFCGVLCHGVMDPEYTAYQQSPHARVDCVECHIGEGASWFVKSKISGIRQVFTYALDIYEKPIPPALTELRPARETCEQCHWPAKFHGDQLKEVPHFASDRANTERTVTMMVKTGGADPLVGDPSGIHWHMALGNKIEYIATDAALQEIPWVKVTSLDSGESEIYRADGAPADAEAPEGVRRVLDCMDCHNRPTHVFRSPNAAVNEVLGRRPELTDVPYAKARLVLALSAGYDSQPEAVKAIERTVEEYYREQQPQVWHSRQTELQKLVDLGQDVYERNVFPERQASWRVYPNNIGHMESPGCFRCHDGRHVNESGEALTRDCKSCHEFLVPAETKEGRPTRVVGSFEHPLELSGPHAAERCDQCHTGGPTPPPTCTGCHEPVDTFRAGDLPAATQVLSDLDLPADGMLGIVDCAGCHGPEASASFEQIGESCLMCHEPRYAEMPAQWREQLGGRIAGLRDALGSEGEAVLDALEHAGVQHNPEAARAILDRLEKRSAASGPD